MTEPPVKVVHIHMVVHVEDEKAVMDYVRQHTHAFGFPNGYEFELGEAVYEALVLHHPTGGPDAIGCEIQSGNGTVVQE